MKQCIFCHSSKLYVKSKTQWRCVTCKRIWSEAKYQKELLILEAFLADKSILDCAKMCGVNYITAKNIYHKIRLLLTSFAQERYLNQSDTFSEYDEFYYLPKIKRNQNQYLFDAIGVFGMLYEEWVYTLLLPDQFTPIKRLMEHDVPSPDENATYARTLQRHKVTHISRFEHRLGTFWNYFEAWIAHFKGVKKENLIYYLKEAEFKFNYTPKEQKKILTQLWKQNM